MSVSCNDVTVMLLLYGSLSGWQDKASARNTSSDVGVNSRNYQSSSHNSDTDRHVGTAISSETRLPYTSSVASTIPSDRTSYRTLSNVDSETEPRTVNRLAADGPQADAVRHSDVTEQSASATSWTAAGVPSLSDANSSQVPRPTAVENCQSEAENFVAQWTTGDANTQMMSGRPVADHHTENGTTVPATAADDDGWYYFDPQGQIQGQLTLCSVSPHAHFTLLRWTVIHTPLQHTHWFNSRISL